MAALDGAVVSTFTTEETAPPGHGRLLSQGAEARVFELQMLGRGGRGPGWRVALEEVRGGAHPARVAQARPGLLVRIGQHDAFDAVEGPRRRLLCARLTLLRARVVPGEGVEASDERDALHNLQAVNVRPAVASARRARLAGYFGDREFSMLTGTAPACA